MVHPLNDLVRSLLSVFLGLLFITGSPHCYATPGSLDATEKKARLQTLDGVSCAPFDDAQARAFVFIFVSTTCPISNAYAPEIRRLYKEFSDRHVAIHLVYPDPDEDADLIRKHLREFNLPEIAFRDPVHSFVHYSGATVTPEAIVYSQTHELVYRGRIDDQHVAFGQTRRQATQRDLALAIDSTLLNQPPTTPRTKAVGCYIGDLK